MKKIFSLLIIIFIVLVTLIIINLYKIYNNVSDITLLSEYIINNENDITKKNNIYLFNGNTNNNYVLYNNLIWRILKINSDTSIKLILDDYLNMLPKKDIDLFLKNLENNLDLSYLKENITCKDEFTSIDNITCNKLEKDEYVSLLSVYEYINTFNNDKTFITNEKMWLYNGYVHTNKDKLSISDEDNYYEIKPVITVKNNTLYKSGNGSKDNPYIVGDNLFSIGSLVNIYNDTYIVYDYIDSISLMSMNTIDNVYKKDAINYIKNKLNYKDKLINIDLPSIKDIKFDSSISNYYLSDSIDNFLLVYNNPIIYGDEDVYHKLRYTIKMDKKYINDFILKDGIYVYRGEL